MGERSSYVPGTFCWADLGTTDPGAATRFYTGLFGWEAVDRPMGDGGAYTVCRLGGLDVCALYGRVDPQGPPAWLSYVSVEDAAAVASAAGEAGGAVVSGPIDVFDAGRMVVLHDPTGAVFAAWQPGTSIGATVVNDPGAMCINQLNTRDPDRAAAFYTSVFGWRFEQVSSGETDYWGIFNGTGLNGGMMRLPEGEGAPPHWLVYFATEDIDATTTTVGELGGQVLVPPVPIPGGRIAVHRDPQGAVFALFAGRLDP